MAGQIWFEPPSLRNFGCYEPGEERLAAQIGKRRGWPVPSCAELAAEQAAYEARQQRSYERGLTIMKVTAGAVVVAFVAATVVLATRKDS